MQQVESAADIAEFKYPAVMHTLVWLFDQSSCHRKMDNMALQASKLLVKDGGPQRVHETTWAGQPQRMINDDGTAEGLRTILRECSINTASLKANDMRIILQNHEHFRTEKTIIEHYNYLQHRSHEVIFLPKFHCELNAIERVWAQVKCYTRAYTNFSPLKLQQLIEPALDSSMCRL